MRLAHFSDLHLLHLESARARDFLNKRWLGAANLLLWRAHLYRAELFDALVEDLNAQPVDHAAFTGDITTVALEAEFGHGKSRMDRLVLGPQGVTCIPGNHDVYVRAMQGRFEQVFAPYCSADDGWAWPDGSLWPIVRVRGELAVIGLTTCWPTPWLMAYGHVGEPQLTRLAKVLADPRLDGKFRVVLLHHAPAGPKAFDPHRNLHDRRAFARVLRKAGAELVLHGHEHIEITESLAGPDGPIPVGCVPAATYEGVAGHPARRGRYRIYEIERRGGPRPQIVGTTWRGWRPAEGKYGAL